MRKTVLLPVVIARSEATWKSRKSDFMNNLHGAASFFLDCHTTLRAVQGDGTPSFLFYRVQLILRFTSHFG